MKNVSIGKKIKSWDYIDDKILDDKGIDLLHGEALPYADGSVDNIYINHVLEYLYDTSIIDLFKECYRVMKRRGMLRIAAINSTYYAHAFRRQDKECFYDFIEGIFGKVKLQYPYHKAAIDQLFLLTFATQVSDLIGGKYEELNDKIDELGLDLALNEVLKTQVSKEYHMANPGFINHLTIGKLHNILLQEIKPEIQKGFPLVYISSYGQSSCPLMRGKEFDSTYPQGSLYIECMR